MTWQTPAKGMNILRHCLPRKQHASILLSHCQHHTWPAEERTQNGISSFVSVFVEPLITPFTHVQSHSTLKAGHVATVQRRTLQLSLTLQERAEEHCDRVLKDHEERP